MKISAILLAGGKSKRMKKDKRFIILKDKNIPLWQNAIILLENFVSDIIISAPSEDFPNLKYPVVTDKIPNIGPIGGIYTCLPKIKNDAALIMPVDMPLLSTEIISSLIKRFDGRRITIATHNNKIEPLLGIYPKKTLRHIEKNILEKNYKIRQLYQTYPTQFVDFEDEKIFLNLNRPEDLKELEKYLKL